MTPCTIFCDCVIQQERYSINGQLKSSYSQHQGKLASAQHKRRSYFGALVVAFGRLSAVIPDSIKTVVVNPSQLTISGSKR